MLSEACFQYVLVYHVFMSVFTRNILRLYQKSTSLFEGTKVVNIFNISKIAFV